MKSTKRYVKYMVSLRCKMIVKDELQNAGIKFSITPHDAIELPEDLPPKKLEELDKRLRKSGLQLLNKENSMLIDRIVNMVYDLIHDSDKLPDLDFNQVISRELVPDGEKILKIFSDVKGVSIIQYIITQKVERIKELILYDELSLEDIAEKLRYKNEEYLIAQFKKHTGLTPSYYKKLREKRKRNLSEA